MTLNGAGINGEILQYADYPPSFRNPACLPGYTSRHGLVMGSPQRAYRAGRQVWHWRAGELADMAAAVIRRVRHLALLQHTHSPHLVGGNLHSVEGSALALADTSAA